MADRNNSVSLLWLLLIACVAFILRFKGVWFGYPLSVHPDEPKLVETALGMIETGDLNPHFFRYPTLNIYLQASLYKLIQFVGRILGISPTDTPTIWYYIAGRTFNVVLSVLTIIITYMSGKRLFSSFAGLLAACFFTFSFLHVSNSYVVTVDSSVAFWLSLSALISVLIHMEGRKTRYYLLGGILVGLAVSSKYTAFVCVASLLVAHLSHCRSPKNRFDRNIVLCLMVIPIAFLVTTPYAVLDYGPFLGDVVYEAAHYSRGHAGAESDSSTSYHLYANYLVVTGYGVIPMIFAGLGLIWLIRESPWKAAIIAISPILLLMFVGGFKVFLPRNIVAVIPFLSLLSSVFVCVAYKQLVGIGSFVPKRRRFALANFGLVAVLAGSIWHQAFVSINHIAEINLPDTRWVSIEYIERSLPPGSRIGREHYTPPIEQYSDKFITEYLGHQAVAVKPDVVMTLDYMLVSSGDYNRFIREPSVPIMVRHFFPAKLE